MFALLLVLACAEDLSQKAPAARVETPAPAPAPPVETPAPAGAALAIDPARSSISAKGAKITKTHDINFPEFSGSLKVEGDKLAGVEVVVKMAALVSDSEKLTGHLKNQDFFSVDTMPESKFVGTVADGAVTGDLTLHGVTKQLSFPATVSIDATTVSAETEFTINRQDFGVSYPGKPDDLIQDSVVIKVKLVASR
ncbi:MAG: YceI family protein [Deltaproteobacteria bacterium]|nr:YceI family protein [Deltaproteobacteria bacterium]